MLKGLAPPSFQGGCLNLLSRPLLALSLRVHSGILSLQKEVEEGTFSDLHIRSRRCSWPCLAKPPGTPTLKMRYIWTLLVSDWMGTAERLLMGLTVQLS